MNKKVIEIVAKRAVERAAEKVQKRKPEVTHAELVTAAKRLRKLNRLANLIKDYQDEMKETLKIALKERDLKEFNDEGVRVTYSKFEKESVSTSDLRDLFPEIFNKLATTNTIERVTVK